MAGRIGISHSERVIGIKQGANGAAGAAQEGLVLVVELHDVGLNAGESIESFAAADGIGIV